MKRLYILPALLATILLNPSFIVADQIQPLLDVGSDRQQAEEKSQSKIDQTDDDKFKISSGSATHLNTVATFTANGCELISEIAISAS